MVFINSWLNSFPNSLQGLWFGVASIVPNLIFAIIIFAIGWVFAALIEKLVESIFKAIKVDAALKSAGLEDVVKRSGYNQNSGLFVGALVKWFIIVAFLMASFDALNLGQVNQFLLEVVNYIPQVIIAVLILMVAVVIANALQKIVVASARAGHIKSAELLGRVAKWAIWIFAIIVALDKLVIIPGLIESVITPIFAGLALAFGLAFGLGGKETAQRILDKTAHTVLEKE